MSGAGAHATHGAGAHVTHGVGAHVTRGVRFNALGRGARAALRQLVDGTRGASVTDRTAQEFRIERADRCTRAHARPLTHVARRATWRRNVLVLACLLTFGAQSRQARATSGQWQGGAGLGAAWLDEASVGPALAAHVRRGLSTSVDLEVQAAASLHPFRSASKQAWAGALGPGLAVRWDVLRWIPFAGAGVAYYRMGGSALADADLAGGSLGVPLSIGVDYLLSRSMSLNLRATAHTTIAPGGPRLGWAQLTLGAAHAWGE